MRDDGGMARALLLSGPLGLGHEMPVQSLRALLQESGWGVRTLDSMALLGSAAARAGQRVFDTLMAVPGLYDGLHFAHLRTGSALSVRMDSAATARTVRMLRAELDREPADVVISVFATGAGAAAALKDAALAGRRSALATAPPVPLAVVYCPDVAVHRLWVHEGTDLFLVTSPAAAASVRRFRPRAPVAVVPPPVRRAFYDAPSRCEARQKLEIPEDARCVLLIDSGWGFAPIAAAAAALADAGVHVLGVAGRNQRLERELRDVASRRRLLSPFGFTDAVPALMAAADLVVSLPGATTCSEARVVGRPLLLLDVMPGHGRDNLLHELEQGNAGTCGPRAADIAASALAMLETAAGPDPGHEPPRWEPAYAAALARIGLNLTVTPRMEEECAPFS
jgi:processive 1,2-diacylglycerol beta-glucosyltransferase